MTFHTKTLEARDVPEQATELLDGLTRHGAVIGFIAGGYARWVLYGCDNNVVPDPNDIDVFCTSEDSYDSISFRLQALGYHVARDLVNAVEWHRNEDDKPVQVIRPHENKFIKMHGTPRFVLTNFDYTINMVALVPVSVMASYMVVYDDRVASDNSRKQLIINHINCPVALASRAIKYAKRGYSIPIRELAKLFVEWEQRPPEYRKAIADLLNSPDWTDDERIMFYRLLRVD